MFLYEATRYRIRLISAFFLLGVINNVLYVIILSAALDLVGPDTPKAVVLLANILPSVLVKLIAPYVFEYITYRTRVLLVVGLNFAGMIFVSTPATTGLIVKLFGIALASCGSGAGEITFLQVSHAYPSASLAAWSSGTGGAGILGGLLYVASTTWLRISPQRTLLTSSLLPIIMLISYFLILPSPQPKYTAILQASESLDESAVSLKQKIQKVLPLIKPFMLPMFLVYFAEYTINQGLSPTLLFPITETPFKHYRDIYPTYATIYQVGVFISRSSSTFFRVRTPWGLYLASLAQCGILVVMLLQAIYSRPPSRRRTKSLALVQSD
ncbi:hypothetical protein MRB53_040450 [Persea americana]|nr:hypothetical protein MRB53_040450 [Persea americana]